jgi:hypothetical protein
MKTDGLEEFIKINREEFDQLEPSAKVWQNISEATRKPKVVRLNTYFTRAAAVAAILVATSVIVVKTNLFSSGSHTAKVEDPELRELIEAEAFYAHQVDGKLKEIQKCYYTFPELKEDIESDLDELETMYNELKGDLQENISNKAVIEAMIENNRNRLKLVDEVLEQINC